MRREWDMKLIDEIMNCDFEIHYNKPYGYDEPIESYLKDNMIVK